MGARVGGFDGTVTRRCTNHSQYEHLSRAGLHRRLSRRNISRLLKRVTDLILRPGDKAKPE